MNKLMISMLVMACGAAGCLQDSDDAPETTETPASSPSSSHVCVAQSTASAVRGSNPLFPPSPCGIVGATLSNADSTLSHGHPLKIINDCGLTPYIYAQSLWNTSLYYVLRLDATTPC